MYCLFLSLLLMVVSAAPALADDGSKCRGVVTSQRASTFHDVGQHASTQSEPRLGLGNVARVFGFNSVGELGSFLASVDSEDATHCHQSCRANQTFAKQPGGVTRVLSAAR
jgi:hypothetical protein